MILTYLKSLGYNVFMFPQRHKILRFNLESQQNPFSHGSQFPDKENTKGKKN